MIAVRVPEMHYGINTHEASTAGTVKSTAMDANLEFPQTHQYMYVLYINTHTHQNHAQARILNLESVFVLQSDQCYALWFPPVMPIKILIIYGLGNAVKRLVILGFMPFRKGTI